MAWVQHKEQKSNVRVAGRQQRQHERRGGGRGGNAADAILRRTPRCYHTRHIACHRGSDNRALRCTTWCRRRRHLTTATSTSTDRCPCHRRRGGNTDVSLRHAVCGRKNTGCYTRCRSARLESNFTRFMHTFRVTPSSVRRRLKRWSQKEGAERKEGGKILFTRKSGSGRAPQVALVIAAARQAGCYAAACSCGAHRVYNLYGRQFPADAVAAVPGVLIFCVGCARLLPH